MARPTSNRVHYLEENHILALAVFAAMVVHTYFKWKWGTLPELLWGCNVASFVIIVGLWFRQPLLLGTGFLWHIGVGEPGYLFGVIQTGHTTWVSVLVHSFPTLAAFLALRRSPSATTLCSRHQSPTGADLQKVLDTTVWPPNG